MILVSHPTGNTFVRALLQALERQQTLGRFHTTLGVHQQDWPLRLLPARVRRQALRRAYDIERTALMRHPQRELARLTAARFGWNSLTRHESGPASVDVVYRDLDRRVARVLKREKEALGLKGVYAYEDGALWTFEAARKLGLQRFYELPIAYWETSARLLKEEAERYPDWEPTLGATRESEAKLDRKTREIELADQIVVPSRFVLESLPPAVRNSKSCHVVPFGSPILPCEFADDERDKNAVARPLRVLFAGSMTQRKGLADLFAAVKLLGRRDVELVVLGTPILPLEFYRSQGAEFRFEAPRPHAEVLRLMRSCDLMALPSIVEGRALVQQEALACGLPLLVTANAGGDDLVDEGETGFLVPIRSPERIAEKLNWFADNRALLPEMRQAAHEKAARYTWDAYGDSIATLVSACMQPR